MCYAYPGVINQNVQSLLSLFEFRRSSFDRFQVLQIELQEPQVKLHRSDGSLHFFDGFVDALF
jgi:hypothetical protein